MTPAELRPSTAKTIVAQQRPIFLRRQSDFMPGRAQGAAMLRPHNGEDSRFRWRLGEGFFEASVGGGERFWMHAGFRCDGHKVGVAYPAR